MTNQYLLLMIGLLLIFLLVVFIASMLQSTRKREYTEREQFITSLNNQIASKSKQLERVDEKLDNKVKARHAKVMDTLDWMLANGIIDTQQHTQLLTKSLPYL